MSISKPTLLTLPFADSGAKNSIPVADASPLASYTYGFPDVTMHPLPADGGDGVPPAGEDFNGILFDLSGHILWMNAGGRYTYDASLVAATTGYPLGAVLQSNDGLCEYVSLIANNTHNPNTFSNIGPYWAYYGGSNVMNGSYAVATGSANAIVLSLIPELAANVVGTHVIFKAAHTNTGAVTITIDSGATVSLLRSDGASIVAGDIVAGTVYEAVCDTTAHYVVTSPLPSLIAGDGGGSGGSNALALPDTIKKYNGPDLYLTDNSGATEGWATFHFEFLMAATGVGVANYTWGISTDFPLVLTGRTSPGDPPVDYLVTGYIDVTQKTELIVGTISVPVTGNYPFTELPLTNNFVNKTIHIYVTLTDESTPHQVAVTIVPVRLCNDNTITSD